MEKQCDYSGISFSPHDDTVRSLLNNSKLHLNGYGTKTLVNNFFKLLASDMIMWHDNARLVE